MCILDAGPLSHVRPTLYQPFLEEQMFPIVVKCSVDHAPGVLHQDHPQSRPQRPSHVFLAVWVWLFACMRAAVSLCMEVLLSQHHLLESHALSMEWTLPLGQQSTVGGSVLGSVSVPSTSVCLGKSSIAAAREPCVACALYVHACSTPHGALLLGPVDDLKRW